MKLFLINFGAMRRDQIDVARALRKKHHKIQYWVRMNRYFAIDEAEFPETVFHEYLDALKGIPPPGIDAYKYDPWSAREIADYSETESEFMTMADKLYPDWSVNRRKELYYDMLRYWGGVLTQYMPETIIILSVPHELYNLVLYRIAKRRKIRTIILDNTVMDAKWFVTIEDYTKGNALLAKTAFSGHSPMADDLSPEMREYYLTMKHSKDPTPLSVKAFNERHTRWQNMRRFIHVSMAFIRDGTILERSILKALKMFKPNLSDERRAHERPADFKIHYVYFPLQYQPELTTSPLGGVYVDQLLAIKTAAAALPEGWELYVKEHPAQVSVHGGNTTPARYPGFYKSIAEIPNVRLIPINTNTFQLMDTAQTTTTLTGTAAWESILRGKPAVVFGYPWFMNAPGIIRVQGVEDCRKAFEKITLGFKPQESDMFRYLQILDQVSIKEDVNRTAPDKEGEWLAMYRAIENAIVAK